MTTKTPVTTPVPEQGEGFTYDPEFKGPVKSRSCTDVICLFLFLSFIAGWAVISIFAFRNGNPNLLIYPTDSAGNVCGMFNLKDKPYLYFFDLTACASPSVIFNGCPTPQVCVSSCPNETYFVPPGEAPEDIKGKLICKYNTDMTQPVAELISSKACASLYLKSKPLVGRCIPEALLISDTGKILDVNNKPVKTEDGKELVESVVKKAGHFLAKFLNAKELGDKIFSDLKASWKLILIMLVVCMTLAFIWIVLMRWVAGVMIWLGIFAAIGGLAYAFYYSVTKYIEVKDKPEAASKMTFTLNLKPYLASKNTWLAFTIISGCLLLVLLLVLIFLRKRIRIAIALIKEASKAVGSMPPTLLFPLLPYILQLAVCAFWIGITLYIASSGRPTFTIYDALTDSGVKNGSICDPNEFNRTDAKCLFNAYGSTVNLYAAQAYNFFAFLWGVFFVIGIGQVSLAGAFSSYYWTLNKARDVPFCAIFVSFYRCIRYHMGSVAFGSLLISTVRFIRVILEYVEHKCKKFQNPVTKAILWCLKCCFWCLEKFIRFISVNAYIMVAIYGKNFCASARMAFGLLIRNVARVFVLDYTTGFLLLVGKLAVMSASGIASFYVFSGKVPYFRPYIPPLNYYLMPVIVVTFGAYVIASVFFNVYGMAVDTVFLCFLEDLERNDGSPERPYYMSKELMKILNKKNKYRDPDK